MWPLRAEPPSDMLTDCALVDPPRRASQSQSAGRMATCMTGLAGAYAYTFNTCTGHTAPPALTRVHPCQFSRAVTVVASCCSRGVHAPGGAEHSTATVLPSVSP